jgi:hypothetical protein
VVLTFGIRHGAKTSQGHLVGENHDLKLNLRRAKALAQCTLSKDEYLKILRDKGLIREL